mmetsp:Transcript_5956/g.18978  ORF Transcript_5956/g.18978 Transcript_5956/m.18978 type:complete len:216 (+) Transcript_5956:80-727(+)
MRPDAMAMAISATAFAASSIMPPQLPTFPPAPASWDEAVRRSEIDAALSKAWYGLDGHCASDDEEKAIDDQLGCDFASTYGEITPNGARTVFDAFGFFDGAAADATFVDMGCGVGRLCAQAYLECACVKLSVGYEISPSRHGRALRGFSNLARNAAPLRARAPGLRSEDAFDATAVRFELADFVAAELGAEPTHVYLASLCTNRVGSEIPDRTLG